MGCRHRSGGRLSLRTTWFSLALAAIGAALLSSLIAPAHAAGDERVLVLGRISDDPKAHYEQLKPLLDYVVPRMRDVGITEGRILMARDAQQMTSYLRRGRVDWVTETAGTGMQLQQRAGARPLLLTERGGVSRYHGVFFVRRDSGLERLSDLEGRTIAFQNTASTSAYFAPATALLDAGQRLEILLSPMDRPSADAVGYVFARSELNIAAWVHKRLVDAGVVSNLDWDDVRRMPPAFRRDFRVIHETQDFPRALEMVRGDLDPKIEARLREVLLEAAQDPAAREALSVFFRTTRFLPVDPASQQALDDLRRGVTRVREQLE
ncbi:phosphate/phosphite/phosphonate ABC transporter substrate-binding protein [Pseudoxanthomonas mexicana]|uniref:Phosphate/phosphite/phosphonate ABC transporter substrate-binding protein n=1 Tax=Pseudoxanthomonas mexicana TaxID=128785 RepID=A0A7G9TI31_PSEMX|nr:phosphate/phosphite/phosphonate ABC transporter substrate-binding protein [Pseudoxanthomonas sp.]MBP7655714.1 phosphate/phosphite/phosphonate ABC transporter substrate-binding protein [Pseudoxanthomonas sp.]QNN79756.1 phosphate/phosphite/phosphonate ABC transporter substrate-binding protein [Pseudoxanthomonas mexicana]